MTHREQQAFDFARWEECSAELSDAIFSYHYLCIDFDLDCEFGDPQTEEQYHQEKQSFIARNQHRDTHFSFSESRNLQDFTPKMLSIVASTQKSLLLHWFPRAGAS